MASPSPPLHPAVEKAWALKQYGSLSAAVDADPMCLRFVGDCVESVDLKSRRDIVLAAVTRDGCLLKYASPSLQSDEEIVLKAVEKSWRALQYASPDTPNFVNKIVMTALQQDGDALVYSTCQDDPKIVLMAVQQNGKALQYASRSLKNDRTIVLAAVQQDPSSLQYASNDLQNDESIVLAAAATPGCQARGKCFRLLQILPDRFQNHKEIVLTAVQADAHNLQYASDELKSNEAIVLAAVQQDGTVLQYASSDLQDNEKIGLVAAAAPGSSRYGHLILWSRPFLDKFTNNEKIVLAAVQANPENLSFASDELKSNEAIVFAALANEKNIGVIEHVDPVLRKKIVAAKNKCSVSCQEYAAARLKAVVMQVSDVQQTEAALVVTCATLAGSAYVVELDLHTENSTAALRRKVAPKVDVPPASLDILLESGQLCTPHADLPIYECAAAASASTGGN